MHNFLKHQKSEFILIISYYICHIIGQFEVVHHTGFMHFIKLNLSHAHLLKTSNLKFICYIIMHTNSIGLDNENKFCTKMLIFSYQSIVTCVLGAQKNRLIETVLFSTHNMFWSRNKIFFSFNYT